MRQFDSLRHSRQGGVAGIAIVTLILLVMAAMIGTTFTISERVIKDAVDDDQRGQALFLAESGLERASYRFVSGGFACGALAETITMIAPGGTFAISAGNTFKFDGVAALGSGECRITSTGTTTSGSKRIVEAILTKGSGSGTGPTSSSNAAFENNGSDSFTVDSGTELLVVATSWRSSSALTSAITGLTYAGKAMTPVSPNSYSYPALPACSKGSCDPLRVSAQIFYLLNPPAMANPLVVTWSNVPEVFVKVAINLKGVDLSNPIDKFGGNSGPSASDAPFGTVITTNNKNALLIDVIGRDNTGNMNDTGCVPRNVLYDANGSKKTGAVSLCGPNASTGPFALNWSWNKALPWASAVVAISSGGSGAGNGVSSWREVSVAP